MSALTWPRRTWAIAAATAVATAALAFADAPARDLRTWTGGGVTVSFDVPETYGDCRPFGLRDTMGTTGVPDDWRLTGRVNIGYVKDGAFVVMTTAVVEQKGNLALEIVYPPHSRIAAHADGLYEYHVEPRIEVYDAGGGRATFLGGDLKRAAGSLGPGGQDWDVFCRR